METNYLAKKYCFATRILKLQSLRAPETYCTSYNVKPRKGFSRIEKLASSKLQFLFYNLLIIPDTEKR